MSNGRHPTMAMPAASSNTLQVPGRAAHPRRTPAQSSVSLRHVTASARANRGSSSSSSSGRLELSEGKADDGSPSSLQPLMGRDSSGESSNAEQWFNKSNNDVREGGSSFRDNEPPFFMRNSSSLETPPDGQQQQSHGISDSLPLRTELLQLGTDGSGTDDFRSVIDDLTVQNKKLKRRLKKYEKLHDAHLKDDKLFEVRIHGLPGEKKRELEDMLRKFASSLGTTGDNAFPTDGYNTLLPMLNKELTQATHNQSDSAYASMSLSGPGSSAVSGSDKKMKTPRDHLAARQKNIHSYLHDIPLGLMPQQAPANMTERAKKKLVVRKMEQLFVGKGAVGGHHQPLQQQEVSQSAAQADRSARAKAGQSAQAYGAREAQMLFRKSANKNNDSSPDDAPAQERQQDPSVANAGKHHRDTEQRPTQPIDLDPDRAQVPLENIKYMRSMGFSPAHPGDAPEEGHGWIYINFLFNMAQLHTLHVTTDFARDAMAEVSKRLEVSPDGRKVRWRGGKSVTRTSSSGGITPNTGSSSNDLDRQSPRKRLKTAHGNSSSRSNGQAIGGASVRENNRHVYTPMFHHKSSMDGSDDSSSSEGEEDTNESSQRWDTLGNSSGATSSGMQPSTMFNVVAGQKRKKAKRDDGPIIFYNNARFCTDLSGERRPTVPANPPMYSTVAAYPIGDRRDANSDAEGRGPLAEVGRLPEPMNLDDNPTDSSQELSFPSYSPPWSSSDESEAKPVDLEVTGIGGVWPEDNFMLNVETRHAHVDVIGETGKSAPATSKALPPRFANVLACEARNTATAKVGHEVTDVEVKRLQPSELPPALGFMDHEDDTSYDDSDEEDEDMSPNPHLPDDLPPEVSTQPVDFGYRYYSSDASDADEEDSDDESEEGDDDGEVDLLANIRETNPEFVRAQEREYDANMAERLAEDIPAGSSAATAGGGSGYASPASGVAREDVRQARAALKIKGVPSLQREGTSDSMKQLGREGSEKADDESDDAMSDARS